MYDRSWCWSMIKPFSHTLLLFYGFILTMSPFFNTFNYLQCLSYIFFWFSLLLINSSVDFEVVGLSCYSEAGMNVLARLPRNRWAGDSLNPCWGVFLCARRAKNISWFSSLHFSSIFLHTFTALSDFPFPDWWYGLHVSCTN